MGQENGTPYLEARGIILNEPKRPAIGPFSFSLSEHDTLVVLGASGAGKTTLLNLLCGLLEPTEGQLFLKGEDITPFKAHTRRLPLLFQEFELWPHLTVEQNLRAALPSKHLSRSEKQQRTSQVLQQAHLTEKAKAYPRDLSGGEKQRIALMQVCLTDPNAVLLDEPFSALNRALIEQLLPYIEEQKERLKVPFIVVTHRSDIALRLATKLLLIESGKQIALGKPGALLQNPPTLSAAQLLWPTTYTTLRGVVRKTTEGCIFFESLPAGIRLAIPPALGASSTAAEIDLFLPLSAVHLTQGPEGQEALPGTVVKTIPSDQMPALTVVKVESLRMHALTETAFPTGAKVFVSIDIQKGKLYKRG